MHRMTNKRDLYLASALSLLLCTPAFAQEQPPTSPKPEARLVEALQRNRLSLTMTDRPAGPGWDWLVKEARDARFTLIGEQHGVAETAQFSAALFSACRESGYSRMAIELSPPIAADIEVAARKHGVQGIVDLLSSPGVFTFYNQREEAQFLADVIKTAPTNERVLRGLDREIFSDRYLISKLESRVPKSARDPFTRLKDASTNAWARFEQTQNADDMFLLAGDPALVADVRAAWPNPDHESDAILRTLEASLAIEAAERSGGAWPYLQRRTQWKRENLAALLNDGQRRKVMMRVGYSHAIRGANYFNLFEIGTMADEAAALTGDRAFHILVLPGPGSTLAVPGPNFSFVSVSSDEFDEFRAGDQRLTRVLSNPDATGHEVIDLRPLRPLAMRGLEGWNSDLVRTIHGYDAAVIWKGARASSSLK
jgi:erythromycin esterase-like protein